MQTRLLKFTDRVRGDERGAVVILVALTLVVIVGMVAFAVDAGYARATQQQLRASADAGSLAGARVLAEAGVYCQPDSTNSSATLVYPEGDTAVASEAMAAAEDYDSRNREQRFSTEPGSVANTVGEPVCVEYADPTRTLNPWYPTVTVTNEQELTTVFGQILGKETLMPRASASAIVQAVGAEYTGLRPFGVCAEEGSGLTTMKDAGSEMVARIEFVKGKDAPCQDAPRPGNWGILDFDGGSNPTGEIEQWTSFGYRDPVPLPLPWYVEGNPGDFNPGALEDELNSIVGKEITLPYYEDASGPGSNSSFEIVGFVTVELCGWRDSSQKYNHSGCAGTETFNVPGAYAYSETLDDLNKGDTYFDVRYIGEVSPEDLNDGCTVSGECDTGSRSIRLVTPAG